MRWIVLLLALFEAGWFAFDGAHALLTGDYVTPSSGPHAGQLGPWTALVEGVGLEPRSHLVMGIHLGLGLVGLACCAAWARRATRRTWFAMVACAAAGLWYLPFGTLLGVLQLVLLWRWSVRPGERA
ncbi:MAG: hypothetical protein AAF682_24400 [Planctomycetota bacterium]